MNTQSPLSAAFLSFVVPGLGQWYNGQRAKGVSALCMVIGIAIAVALALVGPAPFRSHVSAFVLGVVYLFVWIPAIIDAYQQASGNQQPLLSGEKAWYVIFMLLMAGPGAIPLLWQSRRFSRIGKVLWTTAVLVIFLGGLLFVLFVAPLFERLLGNFSRDLAF